MLLSSRPPGSVLVGTFLHGMPVGFPLHAVHALHAMDTPLAHLLAVAYMETSKLPIGQKKHLDTEQKHGYCNNSKGYKCEFQHNCLYLHLQR